MNFQAADPQTFLLPVEAKFHFLCAINWHFSVSSRTTHAREHIRCFVGAPQKGHALPTLINTLVSSAKYSKAENVSKSLSPTAVVV